MSNDVGAYLNLSIADVAGVMNCGSSTCGVTTFYRLMFQRSPCQKPMEVAESSSRYLGAFMDIFLFRGFSAEKIMRNFFERY